MIGSPCCPSLLPRRLTLQRPEAPPPRAVALFGAKLFVPSPRAGVLEVRGQLETRKEGGREEEQEQVSPAGGPPGGS